jgi:cell division protein FtsL
MSKRLPLLLFILGLFAVGVTAAVAHVSLRTRVIRAGYDLGERMREVRILEEEGRRLRVELSLLRSPERIERVARERLGMVTPGPDRIRVVRIADKVATARP